MLLLRPAQSNRGQLPLFPQQGYLSCAHAQGPKPGSWRYTPTPLLSASELENPDPQLGPLQRRSMPSNRTSAVRFAPALPPTSCPQAQPQPPQPSLHLQLGTRGVERKGCHEVKRSALRHQCRERGKEANDIHVHQETDKTTAIIKFHYDS